MITFESRNVIGKFWKCHDVNENISPSHNVLCIGSDDIEKYMEMCDWHEIYIFVEWGEMNIRSQTDIVKLIRLTYNQINCTISIIQNGKIIDTYPKHVRAKL